MKKVVLRSNAAVLKAKSIHIFVMNAILSFIVLNRRLSLPKTVSFLDSRLTRARAEVDCGVEKMLRLLCKE